MMKQTANLRFIKRQVDKDIYRILQQQWIDDDPPDEGATRYAWRDVPTAEEQDAVPPPQVDSGREEIARIIDPSAMQLYGKYKNTDVVLPFETGCSVNNALAKADAILALRPERSGGRG